MAIDPSLVTNAVLAHMQGLAIPVGDARSSAPDGIRGILEPGTGTGPGDGDMAAPERDLTYDCNLRAVAGPTPTHPSTSATNPREAAEAAAALLRNRLLDRSVEITGAGFRVARRTWLGTSGPMLEGTIANVVDQYRMWVVVSP